jgi:hypothetical protein
MNRISSVCSIGSAAATRVGATATVMRAGSG